jgi:TetR/AcrR family transcriptional regulator, cholesterol catabolism regulator
MSGEVKAAILRAALHLFSRKGYIRTSMAEVAEAVELTKGGIYHHIEKKEDLLRLIHNEMTDAFIANFRRSGAAASEPREKLMNWIEAHVGLMRDYQPHIKVFFTELDHLSHDAGWHDILLKRDEIFRMLHDIIVSGIEVGQFRRDLDPRVATLLIFGTLNWFYQWYRPDGPLAIEKMVDQVKKFVGTGILMEND